MIIKSNGAAANVVVLPGVTYIQGNNLGRTDYFGMPQDDADRLGRGWLALRPSDGAYTSTTEGVTMADVITELHMPAAPRLLPATSRDGQHVIGLTGISADTSGHPITTTMWVRADGDPLPVAYEASGAATAGSTTVQVSFTVTFSNWGEHPQVQTPPSPITTADLPTPLN